MVIDGMIVEYLFYVALAIYYQVRYGMVLRDLIIGSIASIIMLVGKITVALAVAEGLAAPA